MSGVRADQAAADPRPLVHLVGAGPGDPLLLTRKAARLLATADVVVLDRPSLSGIAALAPREAERCFVGRTAAGVGWETDRIVDLLADRADRGLIVIRLKGGDPFICSRGGEERQGLLERNISCDVVPGVTAATAAPLLAGVPRGRSVTILAGNDDPAHPAMNLTSLADPAASLIVLTGRARQAALAATLVAAGLDPATPVAVIHGASRPGARVATCSLSELGGCRLPPPATVVIGPEPSVSAVLAPAARRAGHGRGAGVGRATLTSSLGPADPGTRADGRSRSGGQRAHP